MKKIAQKMEDKVALHIRGALDGKDEEIIGDLLFHRQYSIYFELLCHATKNPIFLSCKIENIEIRSDDDNCNVLPTFSFGDKSEGEIETFVGQLHTCFQIDGPKNEDERCSLYGKQFHFLIRYKIDGKEIRSMTSRPFRIVRYTLFVSPVKMANTSTGVRRDDGTLKWYFDANRNKTSNYLWVSLRVAPLPDEKKEKRIYKKYCRRYGTFKAILENDSEDDVQKYLIDFTEEQQRKKKEKGGSKAKKNEKEIITVQICPDGRGQFKFQIKDKSSSHNNQAFRLRFEPCGEEQKTIGGSGGGRRGGGGGGGERRRRRLQQSKRCIGGGASETGIIVVTRYYTRKTKELTSSAEPSSTVKVAVQRRSRRGRKRTRRPCDDEEWETKMKILRGPAT